jgi:hypothetical protein
MDFIKHKSEPKSVNQVKEKNKYLSEASVGRRESKAE